MLDFNIDFNNDFNIIDFVILLFLNKIFRFETHSEKGMETKKKNERAARLELC